MSNRTSWGALFSGVVVLSLALYLLGTSRLKNNFGQPTSASKGENYVSVKNLSSSTSSAANIFTGIDRATLEQIKDSIYFKDKNRIYIVDRTGSFAPLLGADSTSFQILGGCASVEMSGALYSKDQHNVWCGTKVLTGADPTTFEYVGSYDENPGDMPLSSGIAKDKNCIYRAGSPILDNQGKCINPTSCTESTLTVSCRLDRPYQRILY